MEVPIYSAPFDMDEESLKKELDIRSDELYQLVAKNGKFVNYLKEKEKKYDEIDVDYKEL